MELVCSSELSRSVPAKRVLASVAEFQAAEFAAAAAGSLIWLISVAARFSFLIVMTIFCFFVSHSSVYFLLQILYLSSEIGLWGVGSEAFIGRLPTAPGKNKAKAVPAFENKDDDDSDDDEEDEEEGDDEDDDGGEEEDASGDEGDNKKEVEDGGDGEDAPANGEGGSEDDEEDDDDEGGDDEEDDDDGEEDDDEEEEEDEDDDEDPEPPAKKRK